MSNTEIVLSIPEELAKNAKDLGLLTPEHLISLLKADVEQEIGTTNGKSRQKFKNELRELQRQNAIKQSYEIMEKLDALPPMTMEEIEGALREGREEV